jgi:3-oxocholest-4-en-26-oyl-CoA dehydrogenase beta subunit
MDFTPTDMQRDLAGLTRLILDEHATPARMAEVERTGERFDRALWKELADAGVLSAAAPTAIGGGGLDLLEQCSVLVELGRAVAPAPYLPTIVAATAIGYFGTDEQRRDLAAPAVSGSVVLATALVEDGAEDPERPATRAEHDVDGWLIEGAKATVAAGTVADAFVVGATTVEGPAAFIVRADAAGLSIAREQVVDGDAAATLTLAGVRVGPGAYLGNSDVLHWIVARSTIGMCAYQLGVLERALELTAEYARTRIQFGRPIGSFQAVKHLCADMFVRAELARVAVHAAAVVLDGAGDGHPAKAVATAKLLADEAATGNARACVQVHGGMGFTWEVPVHFFVKRAWLHATEFGTADDHAEDVADCLLST